MAAKKEPAKKLIGKASGLVLIHQDPDDASLVVGMLNAGDKIEVLKNDGAWCVVDDGYIQSWCLAF